MTYVKCSGCETMIEIPDELRGDCPDGDITPALGEPYYCDACERVAQSAVAASMGDDYYGLETCSHCGKDIYDWSDLGCEYCDCRHPNFGIVWR